MLGRDTKPIRASPYRSHVVPIYQAHMGKSIYITPWAESYRAHATIIAVQLCHETTAIWENTGEKYVEKQPTTRSLNKYEKS